MQKRKPTLKIVGGGKVVGLRDTAQAAASAFTAKPWLTFSLKGQIFVNDANEQVDESHPEARPMDVEIEHFMRVDPARLRAEANNVIQAIRDRISAVQKMVERVALASGQIEGSKAITRDDLPDTGILSELYGELDEAMNERIASSVTEWTYTDEYGEPVKMTAALLLSDLRLAEAVNLSWQAWYNPTKPQSGAATTTKKATGTTGSIPATQEPSSSALLTSSSVSASNGALTQAE